MNDNTVPLPTAPGGPSVPRLEPKPKWSEILNKTAAKVIHALVLIGRFIGRGLSKLFSLYANAGLKLIPEKVRSPFIKLQPLSGCFGKWLQSNVSEGKTVVPIILSAVVLCAVFYLVRPASGNQGRSSSVRMSEVAGRWVGTHGGLVALDITLNRSGSCVYSSGDFAGGGTSRGGWRLEGRTVTVDLGDTGAALSFTYDKDGDLVAENGKVLHRQ